MALTFICDPLLRSAVVVLWLLPCAIQDRRTRQISNWLTWPLFFGAWPAAILFRTLPLALAVLVSTYFVYELKLGLGGADGKIAVGVAAMAPWVLVVTFVAAEGAFLFYRLQGRRNQHLAGGLSFFIGAVFSALVLTGLGALGRLPEQVPNFSLGF
jgi:Flp pilus assembly protein protease CpaA